MAPPRPCFRGNALSILIKLADEGIHFSAPIMKRPIHIRVAGFAFYDGHHFANADPQRGRDNGTAFVGTLWELHPVLSVEF